MKAENIATLSQAAERVSDAFQAFTAYNNEDPFPDGDPKDYDEAYARLMQAMDKLERTMELAILGGILAVKVKNVLEDEQAADASAAL